MAKNKPAQEKNTIESSADTLFETVVFADRRRIGEAKNILDLELNEWMKHKPTLSKIIKLVQENPGLFFLSTKAKALEAAHDYLQTEVRNYRNRHKEDK